VAIRKPGTRLITGVKELDANLQRLKLGTANKVARPALRAGARVLLKSMKARVPAQHKDAKRALGMAVDAKRGVQRAKVGAGVGKAYKAEPKRSGKNSGGVGIGGRNAHWFFLGTGDRVTKSGKSTGQMKPLMPGLVKDATQASKPEIETAIRTEATKQLTKLAKKNGA
jgi:hypothetical protein